MKAKGMGLMVGILLATLACELIIPTTAPGQAGAETVAAETMQALTAVAPPTTEIVQSGGISVTFKNVSFVIPNGLAAGAVPAEIAAVGENEGAPWDVAPAHILFTLDGYPVPHGEAGAPTMRVFPAPEYAEVNVGAANSLPLLQAIIADPSAPINAESAPPVPYFNAAQIIVAQAGIIHFRSGSGVRTLTHYGQFPGPIIQDGQFYHYQGLTSDGKYFVIAILPILSPLQSTSQNPSADGPTYPDFATADEATMSAYYQAMTEKLDAAGPDAFQPSLNQLDALIQSIAIMSQ